MEFILGEIVFVLFLDAMFEVVLVITELLRCQKFLFRIIELTAT